MRRRSPVKPDINVTPLVDVVLVLLIIFMVITPKMEPGKDVELPKAKNVDATTSIKRTPLIVSVTKTGDVWVDDDQPSELLVALKKVHDEQPDRRVVVKGDKAVRYGDVMRVFKQCQNAGFSGVSMQVREG